MPRLLKVAAAQMGPVHLTSLRSETLARMLTLLRDAGNLGAQLVRMSNLTPTIYHL